MYFQFLFTDRIRRMREGNVFSMSTPRRGGGPWPGPDGGGGYPHPAVDRGGTPARSGQGVPPPPPPVFLLRSRRRTFLFEIMFLSLIFVKLYLILANT